MSASGAKPMVQTVLYWPAHRTVRADLVVDQPADVVILDLEDGCPADAKIAARQTLADRLAELQRVGNAVVIRVNGSDTDDAVEDLRVIAALGRPVDLVIPKPVDTAALAAAAPVARSLWCMGEDVAFAADVQGLAGTFPQLDVVIIGAKDLSESIGVPLDLDGEPLRNAADAIRKAAKAAGLRVVDAIALGDEPEVEARCARARAEHYDGVSLARLRDVGVAAAAFGTNG